MAKEENIILPAAIGLGALLLILSGGNDDGPRPTAPPPGSTPAPGTQLTPTTFLKKYWNEAKFSQNATGIPAVFTITQAGLESGWGNHAPKFNFFGIKANSAWKGDTQTLTTQEYVAGQDPAPLWGTFAPGYLYGLQGSINGHYVTVKALFRAYPSARAGFTDHGFFFFDNPRYKSALKYTNDPEKFAQMIAAAGYATDPNYASKLITSMKLVQKLLKSNHLIMESEALLDP